MACSKRPGGVTALSIFFAFGTTMAFLAVVMLLFPGSVLEPLWRLNLHAHEGFAHMGWWAVLLMTMVGIACGTAAVGLLLCMRWGYWAALAILSVNLLGDTANALLWHDWRTLIGLPVGGAMIFYLVKKRQVFGV